MNITYSERIKAPVETVFACVDDDEKMKQWMDGLQETTYPDGQDRENPVGTRFRQKLREGGRTVEYEGEVTAYDKPQHLGVQLNHPSFRIQVDYRFAESDGETRLDYSCRLVDPGWVTRVLGFCFGWLTRRILRKQMAALKELAEREPRDG